MTSLQGGLSIRQRGRQWGIGRAEPCAGPACCSLPPPRLLSCDPPRLPARPAAQGRQWALLACSRRCTGSPRAAAGGRQRGPTCRPRRAPAPSPQTAGAHPPSTRPAPARGVRGAARQAAQMSRLNPGTPLAPLACFGQLAVPLCLAAPCAAVSGSALACCPCWQPPGLLLMRRHVAVEVGVGVLEQLRVGEGAGIAPAAALEACRDGCTRGGPVTGGGSRKLGSSGPRPHSLPAGAAGKDGPAGNAAACRPGPGMQPPHPQPRFPCPPFLSILKLNLPPPPASQAAPGSGGMPYRSQTAGLTHPR